MDRWDVHAEYTTCPCALLFCALVSTAAHLLFNFSLVLLLHFRPRCCKHPFPVITRGPPARFAYLGKLAHRRGAIRRHDSWLASHLVGLLREHISYTYSRAVSRRGHWRSVGLRSTAPLSAFDLPPHSSTHFIHYLLQIRKSLWLFFSICSVPCLLWGMEGPKADGTSYCNCNCNCTCPSNSSSSRPPTDGYLSPFVKMRATWPPRLIPGLFSFFLAN
ncbi:hypothetical protein J3E69DRAFT_299686 [Trichoderma sp. SZMC 28015]